MEDMPLPGRKTMTRRPSAHVLTSSQPQIRRKAMAHLHVETMVPMQEWEVDPLVSYLPLFLFYTY